MAATTSDPQVDQSTDQLAAQLTGHHIDQTILQLAQQLKEHTFINSRLTDLATIGNIYDKENVAAAQDQWLIANQGTYLAYVKSLSSAWPHLRILADFMEISTVPTRWNSFLQRTNAKAENERTERASRTNVTRLDYMCSGDVVPQIYSNPEALRAALEGEERENNSEERELRLFVVEDLSRDVIELLGTHLDIEPEFFREHIMDYAWYNTRDRGINPPNLKPVARQNRWIPIRFVTARYFSTQMMFHEAFKQVERFNVFRRPLNDLNNHILWDAKAIVGITRARTAFWLNKTETQANGAVGVILIDPTIRSGSPLWYGYRNWEAAPGIKKDIPKGPPRDSLYNDFIYWAKRPKEFKKAHNESSQSNTNIPLQILLHIACAEWLITAEYIKTRLCQIEWDLTFPKYLPARGGMRNVFQKLSVWRRLVPLYREILADTLRDAFHFSYNTSTMRNTEIDLKTKCNCPLHELLSGNAFSDDFVRVLSYMEEYQQRITDLTSAVSIVDSQRAEEDSKSNKGVARLTWLLAVFIPLNFISSLFSMQGDLSTLQGTFKIYFAVALPLTIASLAGAFLMVSTLSFKDMSFGIGRTFRT